MPSIYGIGETVFDIIFRDNQPQRAVPGGSTFNALISLGRCGLQPTMVTETGDDHVGRIIQSFMADNGVRTDYVTVNAGTKTHVSLAFLDEHNDAKYQFYKDHASAKVEPRFPDFHKDDIVLFGSFFAINPAIRPYVREFLQRAHDAGCILYYDVNFRAAHKADLPLVIDNIEENMRLATIVRASNEDLAVIYGDEALGHSSNIYNKHVAALAPWFICTKGADGVDVYTHGTEHHFDTTPIETVSTIGAGDNFNAGVVFSIFDRHLSIETLATPSSTLVSSIVATAQAFSAEVCQSLDNYVSAPWAETFVADVQQQKTSELLRREVYLFDLDGVLIDTEGQYQQFWGSIGQKFLPHIPDFATRIKGSTLTAIHNTYFADNDAIRAEVDRRLIAFEGTMRYTFFEGAEAFIMWARSHGKRCAIVTSSNQKKMDSLAEQLPHLCSLFDHVFTAEDAGRGKPFPDCYLRAAQHFGTPATDCVVFEDSINGLKAASASGALVVGLTTTHPADVVRPYADLVYESIGELLSSL